MKLADSSQVNWSIIYKGTTGKVLNASISYPDGGGYSPILLCAPCTSGTKYLTTFPSREVAEQFLSHAISEDASVVLVTGRYPKGEIGGIFSAHAV